MKENVFENNVAQLAHYIRHKCTNVRTERVDGKTVIFALACRDNIQLEIVVFFHQTYAAPLLTFRMWQLQILDDIETRSLVFDQTLIEKLLTREGSLRVDRRVDPVITIVDHPVLGKPFYQLHPCQSAQLLEDVGLQGPDSLEFWWNFYSSVLI
ncbi:Ubiquitin-like-conjugating enzyme ATG10 [Ogataea parapolymorpha DL-1]|uniref:Ubiquitin-like-conjugating enzyme ATG10 n=1 Tax=Ogataea parapolymorpha (strain ATCC 26012 / BCRC 20466 / JCM 22074 / NRRL Y-7560 / DL-1) TaxID=871575 RepID=W1QC41_OGAPD|nr:Ubiquitin-like-conjugating enzyme ATG10 [Ogataea parapolymorpha DL-1]ESW98616.1 Ubiquitin-like-conjugating enzyme ATG10 [Ogataea parapolymorpha DL-1]